MISFVLVRSVTAAAVRGLPPARTVSPPALRSRLPSGALVSSAGCLVCVCVFVCVCAREGRGEMCMRACVCTCVCALVFLYVCSSVCTLVSSVGCLVCVCAHARAHTHAPASLPQ